LYSIPSLFPAVDNLFSQRQSSEDSTHFDSKVLSTGRIYRLRMNKLTFGRIDSDRLTIVRTMGGDLEPSLGEDGNKISRTKFSNPFKEKFPFERPKSLITSLFF